MNKPNVTKLFNTIKTGVNRKSPEILIGLGIAGMITTTVLAVKATPKALELIEEEKRRQNRKLVEESLGPECNQITNLKPLEVIKVTWKCYIPAAVTGTVSIACLIGSNSVNARRNAALATAYKLSETALTEYKDKVIEEIGEQKEKVIREKIAQDKIDKSSVNKSEVVVVGSGDVLFLEPVCGKPFKSDIETVRKVINDFNYRMTTGQEEYISLSEFYDEFGLRHTTASDDLGWNLGRDGQIDIDFVAGTTEEGKPCLVLDYRVAPRYDYATLY